MIRSFLAAALCLIAAAANARPAMTVQDTTMRAAPSPRARAVQQIPAQAQIDLADCEGDWCSASWRNIDGFVRVEAIGPNEAPLYRPRRVYGGPVLIAPVFGFGYYHRW